MCAYIQMGYKGLLSGRSFVRPRNSLIQTESSTILFTQNVYQSYQFFMRRYNRLSILNVSIRIPTSGFA